MNLKAYMVGYLVKKAEDSDNLDIDVGKTPRVASGLPAAAQGMTKKKTWSLGDAVANNKARQVQAGPVPSIVPAVPRIPSLDKNKAATLKAMQTVDPTLRGDSQRLGYIRKGLIKQQAQDLKQNKPFEAAGVPVP